MEVFYCLKCQNTYENTSLKVFKVCLSSGKTCIFLKRCVLWYLTLINLDAHGNVFNSWIEWMRRCAFYINMYVFPFQNSYSLHLSNLSYSITDWSSCQINLLNSDQAGRIGEWHLDWLKSLSELIQEFLELGHRDHH